MNLKKYIRYIIRNVLETKEKETISDCLIRHKLNIYRKLNTKEYTIDDLKRGLIEIGLKEGDTICVHSSWRSFIGFNINPEDLINLLFEIIGENGNILMPSYGYKEDVFDIRSTPSNAGVVTEVFRNMDGVIRSNNIQFSICAKGPKSYDLVKEHSLSNYAFDKNSPYYKLMEHNGKILMMGLGKTPHKHSIFHCSTYFLKDEIEFYSNIFRYMRSIRYMDNDCIKSREVIDRIPGCKNNKRAMKKAFKLIPKNSVSRSKIGFLNLVIYDSKEAFDTVVKLGRSGYFIYKV